ncbi:PDR/VanB family oxidoreductase [Streptomyces sp. NPDC056296]|uniref:PDR/VanB family oxidoreductase n=1 Tax=Streptomyces sp. NPDC056296 TaxID=3345775 RepID=UPI0035DC5DD1
MPSTHDEVDLRLRVARRAVGSEGVVILELRDPVGADLPGWSPGAHIDLRLPDGSARQYSLCGDPADRTAWRIGVLREPESRGGSQHIHEMLHEGADVDIRGLRNHFPFVASPRYLFIAGGIGITPVLPMINAAEAAGAEWELHYGGRSRRSMAFLESLEELAGNRVTVYSQDEVGHIELDRILQEPRPDTSVYCCGPEPLLAAVERHCATWPEGSLHVERFAPKDIGEPVLNGSFEVELSQSGLSLTVPPDKSVLQVIEEAGVFVTASCLEGTCGTCETPVLEGVVDHRDSLLTPAEQAANDTMFICVSRAGCSRLLLEL